MNKNYERSCLSKLRYWTYVAAMIVASQREASGAPKLKAYKCENCGGWHLSKKNRENSDGKGKLEESTQK